MWDMWRRPSAAVKTGASLTQRFGLVKQRPEYPRHHPLPALRTRKALSRLPAGALLVVECTDPLAEIDIPNLVRQTGDALEGKSRRDDLLVFRIRKQDGGQSR
jgi:tRNA 2-thiouridine synthesizing protein A